MVQKHEREWCYIKAASAVVGIPNTCKGSSQSARNKVQEVRKVPQIKAAGAILGKPESCKMVITIRNKSAESERGATNSKSTTGKTRIMQNGKVCLTRFFRDGGNVLPRPKNGGNDES